MRRIFEPQNVHVQTSFLAHVLQFFCTRYKHIQHKQCVCQCKNHAIICFFFPIIALPISGTFLRIGCACLFGSFCSSICPCCLHMLRTCLHKYATHKCKKKSCISNRARFFKRLTLKQHIGLVAGTKQPEIRTLNLGKFGWEITQYHRVEPKTQGTAFLWIKCCGLSSHFRNYFHDLKCGMNFEELITPICCLIFFYALRV